VATLLTDEDPGFTELIRALLVEHRAALTAELENVAAGADLREDLDIETLLDCIVGAYVAERARCGAVDPAWSQRVLLTLWPAFTGQPAPSGGLP
jgi:hypothetical protein